LYVGGVSSSVCFSTSNIPDIFLLMHLSFTKSPTKIPTTHVYTVTKVGVT
jgi:hypothetical protein